MSTSIDHAQPAAATLTDSRWAADVKIRFAIGKSSLGSLLVAQSERGICAALLGNDASQLVCDLRSRFAAAQCTEVRHELDAVLSRVIEHVQQPHTAVELCFDLRGTPFQQRVWHALRNIPAGKTISYAELAVRIGLPCAARAVAQACAANPIAVLIPCHRVVRSDGSLSGYRWGMERKRMLLAREARQPTLHYRHCFS